MQRKVSAISATLFTTSLLRIHCKKDYPSFDPDRNGIEWGQHIQALKNPKNNENTLREALKNAREFFNKNKRMWALIGIDSERENFLKFYEIKLENLSKRNSPAP